MQQIHGPRRLVRLVHGLQLAQPQRSGLHALILPHLFPVRPRRSDRIQVHLLLRHAAARIAEDVGDGRRQQIVRVLLLSLFAECVVRGLLDFFFDVVVVGGSRSAVMYLLRQ